MAAEWLTFVCIPVDGSCTSRGGLNGLNKFHTQVLVNTSLQLLAKQIQDKYAYIIDEHEATYILKRQTNGLNMSQQ